MLAKCKLLGFPPHVQTCQLFLRATPGNGIASAADYSRLGPLSDGRTCHSVLPRAADFGERMCSDQKDDLRQVVTRESNYSKYSRSQFGGRKCCGFFYIHGTRSGSVPVPTSRGPPSANKLPSLRALDGDHQSF